MLVAGCWAGVAHFADPTYNPGRSALATVTAPASLFGRKAPLGMISFVLINGGLYGIVGLAMESPRWPKRSA
jgi:hypothetical protein